MLKFLLLYKSLCSLLLIVLTSVCSFILIPVSSAIAHEADSEDVQVVESSLEHVSPGQKNPDFLNKFEITFSSEKLDAPIVLDHRHIPSESLAAIQNLPSDQLEIFLKRRLDNLSKAFSILLSVKGPIGFGLASQNGVKAVFRKLKKTPIDNQFYFDKTAQSRAIIEKIIQYIDTKFSERAEILIRSRYSSIAITPNVGAVFSLKTEKAPRFGGFMGLSFVLTFDNETGQTYFELLFHKESKPRGFVALVGGKILFNFWGVRTEINDSVRVGNIHYPPILPISELFMRNQYSLSATSAITIPPIPFTDAYFYTTEVTQKRLFITQIRPITSIRSLSPAPLFFATRDGFTTLYQSAKHKISRLCSSILSKQD